MRNKQKIKLVIDLAMTILLPTLMAYELVGKNAHEWIGICMFIIFVIHHILNCAWHRSFFKGRYSIVRIINTVINVLMAVIMISLMISGIILSQYVFSFLPIDRGISLARTVHLLASYWGFALMSVHIGIHLDMLLSRNKKRIQSARALTMSKITFHLVMIIIASYGINAFIKRKIGMYLFLQNQFVFFNHSEPIIAFFTDYLAIMTLFAFVGFYFIKGMKIHVIKI